MKKYDGIENLDEVVEAFDVMKKVQDGHPGIISINPSLNYIQLNDVCFIRTFPAYSVAPHSDKYEALTAYYADHEFMALRDKPVIEG